MKISPVFKTNYYTNNIRFRSANNNKMIKGICDYTIYEGVFRVYKNEFPMEYTQLKSQGKLMTKPVVLLQELKSFQKGYGKNAIKHVVRYSLANPKTQGRIILRAKSIDGATNPSGFYYKLGFRFVDNAKNKILEKWLNQGGIRELSPKVEGDMYLPKENIRHCLYY